MSRLHSRSPDPVSRRASGAQRSPSARTAWLCAGCVVLGAGCAQPAATDDATAPLRERVATLTGQLEQRRHERDALQRQVRQLHTQIDQRRQLSPAVRDMEFTVQRIDIGWLSGGRGHREGVGDDRIRLFVFPIDQQGHTVKRLGTIAIRLFDLAMPEGRQQIGAWKFEAAEAGSKWTSNLVTYGYQFDLKWQAGPPQCPDLNVKVDFTGLDGKRFSATRQIRVTLPPAPNGVPATRPR